MVMVLFSYNSIPLKKWAAVMANIDLFPQVCISFRASAFLWQAARD